MWGNGKPFGGAIRRPSPCAKKYVLTWVSLSTPGVIK